MNTYVAFDTETTGLEWADGEVPFMIQAADPGTPGGYHALVGPGDAYASIHGMVPGIDPSAMLRRLESSSVLVAHNLPFDVHMTREGHSVDLLKAGAKLIDTDTLARIVAPERRFAKEEDDGGRPGARGYHLKELGERYVDPNAKDSESALEDLAEQHGFKLKAKPGQQGYVEHAYFVLWQVEPEAMEFYGREDTRLTRGLAPALEAELDSGTRRIWEIEQKVAPILIGAEAKGIRVDSAKAWPLKREYERLARENKADLDHELGDGWDENNDTTAEALMMVGVPLTEKTEKSGKYAVNKWALGKFEDEFPIVSKLFEWRMNSKFVSTYLDHFIDREVIHPSFAQIGTWTGRMASMTPNMQNVPVRAGTAIRELMIPREGMAFVGIDYEQIELRALGYYLNSKRVVELIEKGIFFETMAADVWGGSWEDYAKGAPKQALRTTMKNTTYAIIYGAGGMKVAKMIGWPQDSVFTNRDWVVQQGYKKAGEPRSKRAEALIKRVKQLLQGYGVPPYHGPKSGSGLIGRVHDKVNEQGYLTTLLGRKQWLRDGDGAPLAYKGLSGLIQGTAADLFKLGLIDAVEAVEPLGAYPLLFIHDEVLFETPVDEAERTLAIASQALTDCYPLSPRLDVEGAIGYKNWAETK